MRAIRAEDEEERRLDVLDAAIVSIEDALDAGRLDLARERIEAAKRELGADDPDLLLVEATFVWEADGNDAAREAFRSLLARHPDHGDGWYRYAFLCKEIGDHQGMIDAFVRARVLDAKADRDAGLDDPELLAWIEGVAREVLNSLPEPFASKLAHVPITLEPRPSEALVREGFDPRAFGIFEGNEHGESAPAPTCITLFTHNLLAAFDDDALEDEVEVTILHEIGHYFGLDEDDLERLGLE